MSGLAVVILAAGGGTRYSGSTHKLLAPWRGRPVVSWAVDAAREAAVGPVWVVTGPADLADALPAGVRVLSNPAWARGQATSLQVAVRAARAAELDAVVVGLGDQPGIPPPAWRAVAGTEAPIAVATYAGQRRNPVRLSREVWDQLPTTGDQGARVVMQTHPALVTEVPCIGDATDIDTVEDLSR